MSALQGSVRLSELASCSKEERKNKIDNLFQAALNPTQEQIHEQISALDERITKFECSHEMSSKTMRQKLSEGLIEETAAICSWVLLLKAKESFDPESTTARSN